MTAGVLDRPVKAKKRGRGRPLKQIHIVIRPGKQSDLAAIDRIRAPFYSKYDQVPVDPPGLRWVVAERDGEVAAFAGFVNDAMRGGVWVYDFLGKNATAWNHLRAAIERYRDKHQVTLFAYMPIDSKNMKYAWKHGWAPAATIVKNVPRPMTRGV